MSDPAEDPIEQPYRALAPLYDRVMSHVDYQQWAAYLAGLISHFAPRPERVLELGCGTGNITYPLLHHLDTNFLATDVSTEMLAVARSKKRATDDRLRFEEMDFRNIRVDGSFDVVLLVYDGVNYLLDAAEVARLVESVSSLLNPGGIFLFDQSTPANSINNLPYFDDSWETAGIFYARKSHYDPVRRLHRTRFDVRLGQKRATEIHHQRAYDLEEMELTLKLSSLRVEGCFDAFTDKPATGKSERIQWVLTKPRPTE